MKYLILFLLITNIFCLPKFRVIEATVKERNAGSPNYPIGHVFWLIIKSEVSSINFSYENHYLIHGGLLRNNNGASFDGDSAKGGTSVTLIFKYTQVKIPVDSLNFDIMTSWDYRGRGGFYYRFDMAGKWSEMGESLAITEVNSDDHTILSEGKLIAEFDFYYQAVELFPPVQRNMGGMDDTPIDTLPIDTIPEVIANIQNQSSIDITALGHYLRGHDLLGRNIK